MPVALFPPIGCHGVVRAAPLPDAPRYMRTRNMGRWYRPRSGMVHDHDDRASVDLWCGTVISNADRALGRDDPPDDGAPVCGTCEGRAIGAGQDAQPFPPDRSLIFCPTLHDPPRVCPGARLSGLFAELPGARVGACLACGEVCRIGGGYRGAYGWSPLRMAAHPPGDGLMPPCWVHGWSELQNVDGRAVCGPCTIEGWPWV